MRNKTTVQLDYASLLIPIMLLIEGRFAYLFALLSAAAIHECGHLLAARLLHIPISSLRISILGAQLQLSDPLLSYRREWLICAAGPLFSILFCMVTRFLGLIFPYLSFWAEAGAISAALGIVNLLPIGWLDGGRMFRAICYHMLPHGLAHGLLRTVSFLCFLLLWMISVYLLLRVGNSLSLFIFSFSLFLRFFLSETV